jgi:hypothetical protein
MDRKRRGDFLVPKDELDRAEEVFADRSPRSQAVDRAFREPITEDVEQWEETPRLLDYPGVDTPTDEPRHTVWDFPMPAERARFASGRQEGVQLAPDPKRDPVGLKKGLQAPEESVSFIGEAIDESIETGKSLLRGLF